MAGLLLSGRGYVRVAGVLLSRRDYFRACYSLSGIISERAIVWAGLFPSVLLSGRGYFRVCYCLGGVISECAIVWAGLCPGVLLSGRGYVRFPVGGCAIFQTRLRPTITTAYLKLCTCFSPFAQRISKMFTDYGFTGKEIAIMPTITSLQETLVQNSEFFRAGKTLNTLMQF